MGGHLPLEVMLLDRPIDPGGSTLNDTSYVFFFSSWSKVLHYIMEASNPMSHNRLSVSPENKVKKKQTSK